MLAKARMEMHDEGSAEQRFWLESESSSAHGVYINPMADH